VPNELRVVIDLYPHMCQSRVNETLETIKRSFGARLQNVC
jgi:hypothetical protein